jgi:hypothetical protein
MLQRSVGPPLALALTIIPRAVLPKPDNGSDHARDPTLSAGRGDNPGDVFVFSGG